MTVRRNPTSAVAALIGLAIAIIVSACGIPTDGQARAIDRQALPSGLIATPTTVASSGLSTLDIPVSLYLVGASYRDGGNLVEVPSKIGDVVDGADLPRRVIEQLISQEPQDRNGSNLTNAIPSSVQLLNASLDSDVLTVDLSNLGTIELTRQRLAAAQIVFTATNLPGINSVRFFIDGQASAVPLASGSSTPGQAITRDDYQGLLTGN